MPTPHQMILTQIENETGHIDFSIPESLSLPTVHYLLSRHLLDGGKKLRPYLCLCFGKMLGLPASQLEACARIAEIVHSASLAHDDVIDEARVRRGRRTLNASTSNAQAVLAGDLLLARSTSLCLDLGNMTLARDLADTLEELVAGEWLQLEARGNFEISERHLERVSLAKTASLLRWCFLAPLRLAGLNGEIEGLANELARLIGLSFQMSDDCVDYSRESGKEYGKDYSEGLLNWVSWTLVAWGQKPDPSKPHGWEDSKIHEAVEDVQARASMKLKLARECLEQIFLQAQIIGLSPVRQYQQNLFDLIGTLEKRSF
ncbi:MAG: polyprenyl synthetase family protein [Bdellovibrionota bacterium]